MSPQSWLCRSERYPALDTLALNSPLVHLNGDNAYSPQIPDTQTMVTPKHNPSHVRRHTLPSQPSQLLITQFRLNKRNFSTSLAAQKADPIYHAANKNLILKTPFDSRHLLHHPPFIPHNLARELTTLSEETTQLKHTYFTTYPR